MTYQHLSPRQHYILADSILQEAESRDDVYIDVDMVALANAHALLAQCQYMVDE